MKLEKLMKSDGNGKLTIPKWFLLLMMIIVSVCTAAASIGAQQAKIKTDIQQNSKNIEELQEETDRHQEKINRYNKDIAVIKNMLSNIQNNIKEIKESK